MKGSPSDADRTNPERFVYAVASLSERVTRAANSALR